MFCPNCGNQLDEGVKFCRFCGSPVAVQAPALPQDPPAFETAETEVLAAPVSEPPAPEAPAAPVIPPVYPQAQPPVYQAPASPLPQQPVYQAPAAPVYQQPAYQAPVYSQPQQPVYQAPVQSVVSAAPVKEKFPAGSLVCLILTLLFHTLFFVVNQLGFRRYGGYGGMNLSMTVPQLLFYLGVTVMIVGVCLKQKAPWLFGVGVVLSGVLYYLAAALTVRGMAGWNLIGDVLIALCLIFPCLHYFIRGKLKGLKTAFAIIAMIFDMLLPTISFTITLVNGIRYDFLNRGMLASLLISLFGGLIVPLLYGLSILLYSSKPKQ